MTTGFLIKKDNGNILMAADTKVVGGHEGKGLTKKLKEFNFLNGIENKEINFYYINAGNHIDKIYSEIIYKELEDIYKEKYTFVGYHEKIKDIFSKYNSNGEIIILFIEKKLGIIDYIGTYRLHLNTDKYIESIDKFCFIGSGKELALGAYFYNGDNLNLNKLFKGISRYDIYTNDKFDFIEINTNNKKNESRRI